MPAATVAAGVAASSQAAQRVDIVPDKDNKKDKDKATRYYRSQVGESSVINYSHTDFPWRLFAKDVYYFFVYSWALPWIVWPLASNGPRHLNELTPTLQNAYCIIIHTILVVLQLLFLISLPFSIVLPIWVVAAGIAGFMAVNWFFTRLLNGTKSTFKSDEKYTRDETKHEHEQWVFLNGVAVGQHWMMGNVNRLALTFRRPILGIHNPTSGIIFDIIEVLIQRNFGYATNDVRVCFKLLKEILYDPNKSKVVFILHSQGAIEGGLVLDWLLQELPQDLLSKLEVYTFGSAANHFNNPNRHNASQALMQLKPLEAMSSIITETTYETPLEIDETPTAATTKAKGKRSIAVKIPPSLPNGESSLASSRSFSVAKDKAISHVEHYAHSTDFVAIWGVLHFATNAVGSPQLPRFLGRLFARSNVVGGHQLNQHYLDGMFPLKYDAHMREWLGADEDNAFMEEVVKAGEEGEAMANVREAFDFTWTGVGGFGSGDISTPVEVHGLSNRKRDRINGGCVEMKVKDLSRLWLYRNGMSPPETPPMLVTEAGLVRTATC